MRKARLRPLAGAQFVHDRARCERRGGVVSRRASVPLVCSIPRLIHNTVRFGDKSPDTSLSTTPARSIVTVKAGRCEPHRSGTSVAALLATFVGAQPAELMAQGRDRRAPSGTRGGSGNGNVVSVCARARSREWREDPAARRARLLGRVALLPEDDRPLSRAWPVG